MHKTERTETLGPETETFAYLSETETFMGFETETTSLMLSHARCLSHHASISVKNYSSASNFAKRNFRHTDIKCA